MARRSFVNGLVWDATQCSGSAGTAIADNGIAVLLARPRPGAGNAAAPTAVTSGARKDGLTIGIANGNTGGAVDEATIKAYIESQQWDEDDQGFKITAPTEP
jgi:hypothetical protein